jgi:hypothetical protein
MHRIDGLEGEILKKHLKEQELDPKHKLYVNMCINTGLMTWNYNPFTKKITYKTSLEGQGATF